MRQADAAVSNASWGESGQASRVPYMPPENPASIETEWLLILKWQKGMVSADQARGLGMSVSEIRWKVKSGKWQWIHRGVYATFSGELPWEARLWAVVLSIGGSAALSHGTAAELHGFGKGPVGPIHVTVPLPSEPGPTVWAARRDRPPDA